MKFHLNDFKERLYGKTSREHCKDNDNLNVDLDGLFGKKQIKTEDILSKVQVNACLDSAQYKINPKDSSECKPKILSVGLIEKTAKWQIGIEKDDDEAEIPDLKINDRNLRLLVDEAILYRQNVEAILSDEDLSQDEKTEILANYEEYVLLGIREYIVIRRSYNETEQDLNSIYEELYPVIPARFVSNDVVKDMIELGPNPISGKYNLKLTQYKNDFYKVKFDEQEIFQNDLKSLLKAPVKKKYVLAMKWMTLHMMASQIYLYRAMTGQEKGRVNIPQSCRSGMNSNFPEYLEYKLEEGQGQAYIDNILKRFGLVFSEGNSVYLDYYLNNISKDPMKMGYSPIIPFEDYEHALKNLEKQPHQTLRPMLDDFAHFDEVLGMKKFAIDEVFKKKKKGQEVTYEGYDIFNQILEPAQEDQAYEVQNVDGKTMTVDPTRSNLSFFLANKMKNGKLVDYKHLISKSLEAKLKSKTVRTEFPSLYSSPVWRVWSLKTLAHMAYESITFSKESFEYKAVENACILNSFRNIETNRICGKGNLLQNLYSYLYEYTDEEQFVPLERMAEKKWRDVYPLLGHIWNQARETSIYLKEAKTSEYDVILSQLEAGNRWAAIRLSYEILLEDLINQQKAQLNGKYSRSQQLCSYNNVGDMIERMKDAGDIIGLNSLFSIFYSEKILNSREKNYVWGQVISKTHGDNANLFIAKRSGKDFYQTIDHTSYSTIIDKVTYEAYKKRISPIKLSALTEKRVGTIQSKLDGEIASFFYNIYKQKGNLEAQKKMLSEFSAVNGIDSSFSVKLNFLQLDNMYKEVIYHDLIHQAAEQRKNDVENEMEKFCQLNINDDIEFRRIYYSSLKAQNELNQMAGIKTVPSAVTEKLNSMTEGEHKDMITGFISAGLGIGAIVIGGACTAFTGSLCAPLGVAMVAAGAGSIGLQLELFDHEVKRKLQANESADYVKNMAELGFSEIGSQDALTRSWFWSALEASFTLPLIGIVAKSAAVSTKLAYVTGRQLLSRAGKESFKRAAKNELESAEIRYANLVLGVESHADNLNIKKPLEEIRKLKLLYKQGDISLKSFLQRAGMVVKNTEIKAGLMNAAKKEFVKTKVLAKKAEVDRQTAKVVSQFYNNNPESFLRLIRSYSGERLNKAIETMSKIENKKHFTYKLPYLGAIPRFISRMRTENLSRNASKILRIEKELAKAVANKQDLESFVLKNMDDLTDIFFDITTRKREFGYLMLLQGFPRMSSTRSALFGSLSEGVAVRQFFIARSRLVYEATKKEAQQMLGLKPYIGAIGSYQIMKAFQVSLLQAASVGQGEAVNIFAKTNKMEIEMAKIIFEKYRGPRQVKIGKEFVTLDESSVKRIVFHPSSAAEEAFGETLFEAVKPSDLYQLKETEELAYRVAQDLANYKDVDEFERYLNALKVLSLNKSAGSVEIF